MDTMLVQRITIDIRFIQWTSRIIIVVSGLNLVAVAIFAISGELASQLGKYGNALFISVYIGNLIGLFSFSIPASNLNSRFVWPLAATLGIQGFITAYMQYAGGWSSIGTTSDAWRSDEEVGQFYETLNGFLEIVGYVVAMTLLGVAYRLWLSSIRNSRN